MNSSLFSLEVLISQPELIFRFLWGGGCAGCTGCSDKSLSLLLAHPSRQAKRLLCEIIEQCRYGPGFHNEMDGNSSIQQILIPANKVGLVIGKGGETIKQLQVCE